MKLCHEDALSVIQVWLLLLFSEQKQHYKTTLPAVSRKNTKKKKKVCSAAQIAGPGIAGLVFGGEYSELRLSLELT